MLFRKRRKLPHLEIINDCADAADNILRPPAPPKPTPPNIVGSTGMYGGGQSNTSSYKPAKPKIVSKLDALKYINVIDQKIAGLIQTRISKTGSEEQALTVSIMTLEMVRDLTRQIFTDEDT